MSGTVNIARSLFHDAAFKDQPFTEREAFMWMVMEASWKDREKRIDNKVVSLKRGQLAASIRFMAEAWSWEKSTVDRFLKRLKNRDMIGTDSGTGVNVITICKYSEYQGGDHDGGTDKKEKRDSSGTAAGQTRTPDEIPDERREETIVSLEKSPRRKPELPLPEGWLPSERNIADAKARNFTSQEIDRHAEQFRNHHTAKGNRYRDWDAAWRTWLGNADQFRSPGSRNTGAGGGHSSLFAGFQRAASGFN